MKVVDAAGRSVGVLAGGVASLLWMLSVWVPGAALKMSGVNLLVALLMALMALFAMIASLRGHVPVLVVVFVASFFPVGLVLLGAEHWMRWVGFANICYVLAAGLIWLGKRAEPSRAEAETEPEARNE
ncbi:MAG TPA: hypothetical protein VFV10_14110 [Gammaproteobacteria bacterium]|nr:hypothetical protein [Gammaproteobacteria bacterium]